jgi:hypothetical protein
MTESISLNLGIDYSSLLYKISTQFYTENFPLINNEQPVVGPQGLISPEDIRVLLSGRVGGLSTVPKVRAVPFYVSDSDGLIVTAGQIGKQGEYYGSRGFGASGVQFGYNNVGSFGYVRSGESGSLLITNPYSEYRLNNNIDPAYYTGDPTISGYLSDYLMTTAPVFSQVDGKYIGVPIQLGRGEASLNAQVTNVSNNRITWANTSQVVSEGSTNFTNAKVTVLSGSLSGSEYRVVSADNANKYLYLDKSGALSGQIIQVGPRVSVIGYTGWNDESKVKCRFMLSSPLPEGVGNRTGALVYSGASTHNLYGTLNILTSTVYLPGDLYERFPARGDVLFFRTTAGAGASGLIVEAARDGGQWGVKYYPRLQPGGSAPNDAFTLNRVSTYNVELYPQFDSNYTVTSYGDTDYPWFGSATTEAPSASIEIAAGDYDSAFGTVADTSHFHIGPVVLSDGVTLTGTNVYITGSLYNNNPTSTTPLVSWFRFTSADPNIAAQYNGLYSKFGSLVTTYSQAFSTPDMLTLIASAKLGSATVSRVINFPVSPPV